MKRVLAAAILGFAVVVHPTPAMASDTTLFALLEDELEYAMENLESPDGAKPYYLAFTITDNHIISMSGRLGALINNDDRRARVLEVEVRVGDYKLDNTHNIRGGGRHGGSDPYANRSNITQISLDDDPDAIRQAIWLVTDKAFKEALKKYQRVQTNLKTKVEESDKSGDFSREKPAQATEPTVLLSIDRDHWSELVRDVSAVATEYPLVYRSRVGFYANTVIRHMVTSEGTRLKTASKMLRVSLWGFTRADDGMVLQQSFTFASTNEGNLPERNDVAEEFRNVLEQVVALREAPLIEPYTGPAILLNRASAVFFHEIFGHRVEGHRQKDVDEGQTFTKKINEPVLPEFLTLRDDPTKARWGDTDLWGHYRFDDQGVPSSNVVLVEDGVLKSFLLSRSPVQGFPNSNGHGRRQLGRKVVARQANLIVDSKKTVRFERLRELLIEECRKQDKPYGLLFEDISGGFTATQRNVPQSFKVLPIIVYRVYVDGRPDELVRGVDIVGTPLTSFSSVIWTGDDPGVFNGMCGAESGSVLVSAVSPSILVSDIEIEKRRSAQGRPPILDPPAGR